MKIDGSGTATLIISNEEMNDIMKIVHALEDSNILLKGITKTLKNETKEQIRRIFRNVIRYFMKMLVHIGFLYFLEKMKLFISIVLALKMFLKKLKNSLVIKTSKQIFLEYNQTI